MSQNLQYPSNPDTSLESFLIQTPAAQILYFGRTISQAECVPLNYTKLIQAALVGTKTIPLRELIHISEVHSYLDIDYESANLIQTYNQQALFSEAFLYWEDKLAAKTNYGVTMGVVTEITSSVIRDAYDQPLDPPSFGLYRIVTKLKVNWLTQIDSQWA